MVRQCRTITLPHMNNKTESLIFVSLMCSLLLEEFHSEFILVFESLFCDENYNCCGEYKLLKVVRHI